MFRCCFSLKSSSSKGQKAATAIREEGQRSRLRLSDIPDEEGNSRQLGLFDLHEEILIRILSLLPTESAVRTSLLLRNGQHLWKSLTSLEFHEDDMFLGGNHFKNFVDTVMDLRDHSFPLVSFSLQHQMVEEEEDYANHIKTWITKAVQNNVEELTLSFRDDMDDVLTCLPCCIFGCQTLVKLDLVFPFITFNVPSSVICLPRLKYLKLSMVEFEGDESTEKLFSSPVLEKLIIDTCSWYDIGSISVCSPKLQVLEIYDNDQFSCISHDTKICFIGDNLKSFSYTGNLTHEYRIDASSSTQLSKVEIYVDREILVEVALNCYEILKGLSGTQSLALSDYFLEGLQKSPELLDTISIFECLTRLNIRVYKKTICIDSLVLMKIYSRCPHLEYLVVGKLSHTLRSPQLSPIPLCFRTHLKKILVHDYAPGDEGDTAIDVLLNSALVLEELAIYCKRDKENSFYKGDHKIQEELHHMFNRRPRVSKNCVISVRVM